MGRGRHAIQDPAGAWLTGIWALLSAIEVALLGAVAHNPCPCPQTAAPRGPVPASAPDTPPPDF